MVNAVMILILMAIFIFGYFVVDRFGRFMDKINQDKSDQTVREKTIQVFFAYEKSAADIAEEAELFCTRHGRNTAIVFIAEGSGLYNELITKAKNNDTT